KIHYLDIPVPANAVQPDQYLLSLDIPKWKKDKTHKGAWDSLFMSPGRKTQAVETEWQQACQQRGLPRGARRVVKANETAKLRPPTSREAQEWCPGHLLSVLEDHLLVLGTCSPSWGLLHPGYTLSVLGDPTSCNKQQNVESTLVTTSQLPLTDHESKPETLPLQASAPGKNNSSSKKRDPAVLFNKNILSDRGICFLPDTGPVPDAPNRLLQSSWPQAANMGFQDGSDQVPSTKKHRSAPQCGHTVKLPGPSSRPADRSQASPPLVAKELGRCDRGHRFASLRTAHSPCCRGVGTVGTCGRCALEEDISEERSSERPLYLVVKRTRVTFRDISLGDAGGGGRDALALGAERMGCQSLKHRLDQRSLFVRGDLSMSGDQTEKRSKGVQKRPETLDRGESGETGHGQLTPRAQMEDMTLATSHGHLSHSNKLLQQGVTAGVLRACQSGPLCPLVLGPVGDPRFSECPRTKPCILPSGHSAVQTEQVTMRAQCCAALWVLLLVQVSVQTPACTLEPAAAAQGNPSFQSPPGFAEPLGWVEKGDAAVLPSYRMSYTELNLRDSGCSPLATGRVHLACGITGTGRFGKKQAEPTSTFTDLGLQGTKSHQDPPASPAVTCQDGMEMSGHLGARVHWSRAAHGGQTHSREAISPLMPSCEEPASQEDPPSSIREGITRSRSPGLREPQEYELVTPYEVDQRGGYVSHDIGHPRRMKRALAPPGSDALHLRLRGSRHNFHMDLRASSNLVVPGFLVQTLGKGGTRSVQALPREELCFYQGSLRSHQNSSVALSTCQGVSGMIRTQEADYFLKPLPSHLAGSRNASTGGDSPSHILYKRSLGPRAPRTPQVVVVPGKEELEPHPLFSHEHPHPHGAFSTQHLQRQHFCGRHRKHMPQPPADDLFLLPDEYSPCSRRRRSPLRPLDGEELNVETLVVVDKQMMRNHGHENITTYVLTILNMVSALFKDGTIGGNINIAVVGLILLEEEQPGLEINHHADHTLTSFCQWQSALKGKDGARHDHAILLTGLDICSWKNAPCDTLGFAPISGMCSKYRSCTINEDTGLGLAFTIAHESGHNFGMAHDGEGNPCKKSEGSIMSPALAGHNGVFSWSPCSRQYLHKFLSSAQAVCLADQPKPVQVYRYPEKLPGELYDANTQCKWQFGEKARLCMLDFKKASDICKALWCHRAGRKCETKLMPAAEGTACGHSMWCRRGQCVKYGDKGPRPIHGHWADWSPWAPCSRTCGGGVSRRDRLCSNPKPAHGGKFCEGSARSLRLCNGQACPDGSMDFRALQCAEHNSQRFRGWHYKWKPYTHVEDQDLCKLYCIAEGFDFFFSLSNKVKDGTPCSEDSRNVCVDGICERVGCDNVLGSDAVEDSCGVCRGNSSGCITHRGLYSKHHRTHQYYQMLILPAGARSIHIREVNTSTSYLAVRSALGHYYLNGRWTVDWPGRYAFSGAAFHYQRPAKEPESLTSAGPTNETLIVELLFQGGKPGVAWEYSVARTTQEGPSAQHSYTWVIVGSECSVSCGGDDHKSRLLQRPEVPRRCLVLQPQHPAGYWGSVLQGLRLSSQIKAETISWEAGWEICAATYPSMLSSPPSWSTGNWSICSRSCGGGSQSRPVRCTRRAHYREEPVQASLCPQPAPSRQQPCHLQNCPPTWSVGPWAECSRTCGKGWRKRAVTCKSTSPNALAQLLPDTSCAMGPKPRTHEACLLRRCHKHKKLQWLVSAWSQCSVTCERGTQKRFLKCAEKSVSGKYRELASKKCAHLPRPHLELDRVCVQLPCPQLLVGVGPQRATWLTSPWSQCTASCGGGVQTRSVQCLAGGRPASGCFLTQKPPTSLACNTHFCPITEKKVKKSPPCSWVCSEHHFSDVPGCLKCLNNHHLPVCPDFSERSQLEERLCLAAWGLGSGFSAPRWPASQVELLAGSMGLWPVTDMCLLISDAFCKDHVPWCSLVPRHGMCSHQFYGEQCCRTCSASNS
ncbi:A disintegrin and metalloproteinase with thrombospondin motifs 16, partial [Galemys pyrenaicus]